MAYDLVMLALLIYTTARGAAKGMAWQLAAIASLILCFLFATPFSLSLAPFIRVNPPLNRWIAMLVIYLVFSFGCFSVARMLRGFLEQARFEEYDRHLGALFGFVKGAMICFMLTFFTVCLSEQACAYVLRTNSGYLSAVVMRELELIMPAELESVLAQYEHRLDQPGSSPLADFAQREGIGLPGDQGTDPNFRGSYRTVDPGAAGYNGWTPPQGYQLNPNEHGPIVADWLHRLPTLFSGGLRSRVEGLLRNALPDGQPEAAALDPQYGAQPQYPPSQYGTQPPLDPRQPVRGQPPFEESEQGFRMPVNQGAVPPPNRGPLDLRSMSPDQLVTERLRLEDQVAGYYNRDPQQRRTMDMRIDDALIDIPDVVAIAALGDWLSDLAGRGGDPDPETNANTDLNVRISRQLQAAGIRLNQLPRSVEERLRQPALR